KVTVSNYGRDGRTDDHGVFVIQMPIEARYGQQVILDHDKAGYGILFPYRGLQLLPAITSPPSVIEVRMLPHGSPRWFNNDKFIDAYAEYERSKSTQRLTGEAGSLFDPEASLRELADYAGFKKDEVRKKVIEYIEGARKRAGDRHRLANA